MTTASKLLLDLIPCRSEKVSPAIAFLVLGTLCILISAWTIYDMLTFRSFFYQYVCDKAMFSDIINYGAKGTTEWVGV